MLQNKKILLSGHTGFLGSNLHKSLAIQGNEILSLSRNTNLSENECNFDLENSKIDIEKISEFNPEIYINLAWHGIPNLGLENSIINTIGHINLLKEITKLPSLKTIISSGSCFEYPQKIGPCSENELELNTSSFARSKDIVRRFIELSAFEKDIKTYWIRVFYLFGNGQRADALIPSIIASLKKGNVPDIRFPYNAYDFVHTSDFFTIIQKIIDSKAPSGIYNLGSGFSISAIEIAQFIENALYGRTSLSQKSLLNSVNNQEINFWANTMKTNGYFQKSRNDFYENLLSALK